MAYYGITSRMMYLEYVAYLFDLNASLKRKLSDEQLILKILKEFAYRKELIKSLNLAKIKRYRKEYNCGILNRKTPAPQIPSFRYIKGVIVTPTALKPATPKEIQFYLASQSRRRKKYHARTVKKEITKKVRIKVVKKKPSPFKIKVKRKRATRQACKAVKKRRRLQKKMAKLQGVSPWPHER